MASSYLWPAIVPPAFLPDQAEALAQGPHAVAGSCAHPGFIGRKRELGELLSGLHDAWRGQGRLLLVVGEAGIGKTRLIEELAAEAAPRGSAVLWGRCWEGEGAPPYWPWVQILRSHLRTTETAGLTAEVGPGVAYLAQLVPEVRHHLSPLPAPPTSSASDHARFYLFDATTTFLKNIAATTPLVLVFDDLQWADLPSLLLLRFLAREIRDARILLVGTYREAEVQHQPEIAGLLGTLVREGHHVPLRGLSEEEVRGLIEHMTGGPVSPAFVRTVYQKTEGNPFFVDEVVRVVAAEVALEPAAYLPPWSFPLPQGVREAVRRRLAPLPQACTEMLTIASVIGREFDLVSLQHACHLPATRLLQVLGAALTSRIIVPSARGTGRYRFSHVLIRETLYEGLAPADRMNLHSRIGQVLETLSQANPEPYLSALAHHFLQAAPAGEADKGVEYAVRAGKRAAASLAHEEAAELYTRALQVLDPRSPAEEARRCQLLFSLGEAQWRTGDWSGARETFRKAADIARRSGDAVLLARSALGFGGEGSPSFWVASSTLDHTLVTLLEEALAALGAQHHGLRARLLARLSIDLYFSAAREQGVKLSKQAVELARQLGDPQVLAIALRARCIALWRPESADERLAVATEMVTLSDATDDRELTLPGRRFLITGFLERGDIAATDREIAAWADIAEELRQPLYLAFLGGWRAMRAILDGRFAEGEHQAALALECGRQVRAGEATQGFVSQVGILRLYQGRLEELLPTVRAFVDRNPTIPAWRCNLAYYYYELGRVVEARREFDALAAGGFAALTRDGHWLLSLSFLSAVCAGLGDRASALVLYEMLFPYADRIAVVGGGTCWGSVSSALGQLAATVGRMEDAVRHFEQAVRVHERMGAHPLVAWTEYVYARTLLTHRTAGAREKVEPLLERALVTARALGMDGLVARLCALHEADVPLTDNASVRTAPSGSSDEDAVFGRNGDFWTIRFAGQSLHLKNMKGLLYLASLLRHPGKDVHALALAAVVEGGGMDLVQAGARYRPSAAVLPGDGVGVDAGAVLDAQAKRAYQARLQELRAELEEAEACNDPGRVEQARHEIEALVRELRAAVGLAGRDRRALSLAERARVNLTKAIGAAQRKIARQHPALGDYLKETIRTGTFFSYRPDPDEPTVSWKG